MKESTSLWAAIVVHLGIAYALSRTSVPAPAPGPTPIEVEVRELQEVVPENVPASTAATATSFAASSSTKGEMGRRGSDGVGQGDAGDGGEGGEGAAETGDGGAPVMLFQEMPPQPQAAPPSAGGNPFVSRAEHEKWEREPWDKKGLARAMRGHDRRVGMGPEGPVLRELVTATHASLAPERGKARFLVSIADDGYVKSIRFEHDYGPWREVADAVFEALKGTKLLVREAGGDYITILVESRVVSAVREVHAHVVEE